jgi:hypothetical protein
MLLKYMHVWKIKKSSGFYHEIMNLVEKNVGTPAVLGRTLAVPYNIVYSIHVSSELIPALVTIS